MRRLLLVVALLATLPGVADFAPVDTVERPTVGIWITDVYDLDANNRSFTVKFWVWSLTPANAKIRPVETISVPHVRQITGSAPLTVPKLGTVWSQRQFTAVVRHGWDMRAFPFDEHDLEFSLGDTLYDASSLVYVLDRPQSGIDGNALPSTWQLNGMEIAVVEESYRTTFGDPSLTRPVTRWSRLTMHVHVRRHALGIFLKLLLGAYVAFTMALLSFRIHTDQPTLFSARLGLLVGSLFATVVNLRATESVVGRSDDFTLVDKIHLVIAVYILIAALAALISRRKNDDAKGMAARDFDQMSMILYAASFVTVNIVLISQAVMTH
jgi:hypothetical protein